MSSAYHCLTARSPSPPSSDWELACGSSSAQDTRTTGASSSASATQSADWQTKVKFLVTDMNELSLKTKACYDAFERIYSACGYYWRLENPGLCFDIEYPYATSVYIGTEKMGKVCNLIKSPDAQVLQQEIDEHLQTAPLRAKASAIYTEFSKLAEQHRLVLFDPENFNRMASTYFDCLRHLAFDQSDDRSVAYRMSNNGLPFPTSKMNRLVTEVKFAIDGKRPLPPAPGEKDFYTLTPTEPRSGCSIA
jgi:hypothetical protein